MSEYPSRQDRMQVEAYKEQLRAEARAGELEQALRELLRVVGGLPACPRDMASGLFAAMAKAERLLGISRE